MQESSPALAGTAGGTFLSVAASINGEDLVKTILLAVIGATVSFSVSILFKFLLKKRKK